MDDVLLPNKTEDLWNPYKELKNIVWNFLNETTDEFNVGEFESILRRHKQNFFLLLQNPPKNAKAREELKKGMVDGINVRGIGHQVISNELYQEAIILSDMFLLNELVALDLLCTAQMQMPYYPGLPRGLVAVLLYYDGRKALVTTLLYLVQARNGVQWNVTCNPDLARYITDYTDELMEGGLFTRIFELLRTLDLTKEIELLQANLALGGSKHRRQVVDMFNVIRQVLSDIVFTWSAQCGLPKNATVSLINYLRETKLEDEASGKINDVNLYLEMAFLAALDISVLHTREDGEKAVQSLPIFDDPTYVQTIVNEFTLSKSKWLSEGLQALSTFGVAVCISALRDTPQSFRFQEAILKEETLVDSAIEMNVFDFLLNIFLENKSLYKEHFLYKRMHNLITDFIFFMYPKIKDLRMRADEIARTMQVYIREGLEVPSNLPRYFEMMLLAMGKFYRNDELKTGFVADYWSPLEMNASQMTSERSVARSMCLFKFIKLAGDILPSTLFVPYIMMLSGLASSQNTARHCFNMLKQVGSHVSTNLSWDHFFMSFSQYYSNLRQEVPAQADTVYMSRATFHKGVSPQELEGLHAVLELIRAVAEHDEFSRLALCEHPGWSPLTVLLGLVTCSVPIPLKADLLLTLAALAKSSENATQTWENLEASQILVTIPTTSSYVPRGIQTELEEIESRMEEYPLTRAMLKLIDELTNFGIPRMLGAGPRNPGFDPYLSFIINSVFNKHYSRSYRNPTEKWEVALLCLKLFEKFLNHYDPKTSDFPGNTQSESSSPGYHLMLQLNSKSELFYIIMNVFDESNRFFEAYAPFPGEETIKTCVLSSLNIIHRVLVLQNKFFNLLTSSSAPMVLTSINKLLMSINRRTGKPDHCINMAKLVAYQIHMPEHCYLTVKILNHITSSCVIHNQLMSVLLTSEDSIDFIRNGFVECLDNCCDENKELIENTKREIIKLMKQTLSYNAPNFTHFLLGFNMKKDVSKTEFQFPGVLGFPRTSFHSILSMMDTAINRSFEKPSPTLLESVYHLLYLLSCNTKTSGPILRFIRQNRTFYQEQLTEAAKNIGEGLAEYGQITWLMKVLAVELKILSQLKQVTYLKQLKVFLINLPTDESRQKDTLMGVSKMALNLTALHPEVGKSDNFLTRLIPYFELDLPEVEMPNWEYFDNNVLSQILQSCQQKSPPKLIDLRKLHVILYDELKTLQGTSVMGQIQAITHEIQKVLKYALELNKRNEACAIMVQFADAWRQVTEVLVLYTPMEILSVQEQQIVSLALLKPLLKDISKSELLPEVARLLSGTVLMLMYNIKRSYLREMKLEKISEPGEDSPIRILKVHQPLLKEILDNLTKWLMVSDVVNGELRVNLYASLVSFLQLTDKDIPQEELTFNNSLFVSRLDSSKLDPKEETTSLEFSAEVFSKFGDKLIEIICQDCVGGQEVCKILSMSAFTHLMILSGNIDWMMHLSGRGYLKHIIQSIESSNNELRNMVESQTESIKPLYLYTAKMLLLTRLAGTQIGSELLMEQKLFTVFSNMNVFTYHPEISKFWQSDDVFEDFLPPLEQKYLQLWLPTLHICNAVLTTLGTENQSAVSQIMFFLLSHLDVVELILRSGCVEIAPTSLKELALLTSIFSRTASNNLINVLESPNVVQNNRAQLHRIQKLMLSLLPKFILSDENVRKLTSYSSLESITFQTSDRLLFAMQIVSNLLSYSRHLIANNDVNRAGINVLFYPTLSDPLLLDYSKLSGNNEQDPSLGIVVQELISVVNLHHQERVAHELLIRELKDIPNKNSAELKEYLNESLDMVDILSMREKAYDIVSERLEKKKKEINYCAYIIDNCLYLIWIHLDFYMLKAIPRTKNFEASLSNSSLIQDTTLASASEATWKVSTDVISSLKHGLVSLFNDSFTKQLLDTAQDRTESDRGLVEAMLRKIKRLVQFVPVK
ncbi:unnamed protein product [Diabrotica balteata]|uniref:Nuclear pore complex protein Nup205 n=1 Tax=Diabrotica balteata TaxID=107213 RepID=A0A9P0DRX1_DIABA|nr:unnamed protein product [Diabrotica balteata]